MAELGRVGGRILQPQTTVVSGATVVSSVRGRATFGRSGADTNGTGSSQSIDARYVVTANISSRVIFLMSPCITGATRNAFWISNICFSR